MYKGKWQNGQTITEVAIKVPTEGYDRDTEVKLLQEATIMGQFQHPNVLTLFGVVTQGNPVSALHIVANNCNEYYDICSTQYN